MLKKQEEDPKFLTVRELVEFLLKNCEPDMPVCCNQDFHNPDFNPFKNVEIREGVKVEGGYDYYNGPKFYYRTKLVHLS